MIFQNPYASLNPRKTIKQILSLPLKIHEHAGDLDIKQRVSELLEKVGLHPASQFMDRFPHQLSGGQRQRVVIARAIALNPRFIIADEPVSALDVSVRGQILNLMADLQKELNLTYLFITHDLAVVRSVAKRVAVMYLGRIIELAHVDALFENPKHPYTQSLLSATPVPNPRLSRTKKEFVLSGEVPSPIDPPSGCRFRTRCHLAEAVCSMEEQSLRRVVGDHFVACWKAA